jgi:hypothetical protein
MKKKKQDKAKYDCYFILKCRIVHFAVKSALLITSYLLLHPEVQAFALRCEVCPVNNLVFVCSRFLDEKDFHFN